jgi:putative phage-type endonuclease
MSQKYKNRVKTLLKKPQPQQRSEEWFLQRQTRITASEAASCLYRSRLVCEDYVKAFNIENFKFKETEPLNPYETKEDYIIKKCAAYFGENNFKDNAFTLWGKKYEEVANRLYCKLYNTKVHEFGLLPHGRLQWLAASPDGITPDGVMLEIKCPKSRKIESGISPLYYWVQMQIQLEVCDLQYCDFLECEIEEVADEETFKNITLQQFSENMYQDYGIVLQDLTAVGEYKYIYPPMELNTAEDHIAWKNEICKTIPCNVGYYHITKYNVVRIERSKEWFGKVRGDLKNTWDFVRKLQDNNEDFMKYKQSIHMLRSKAYYEKFDSTVCLIDDASSFAFEEEEDTSMDNCLLDSTE